MTANPRTRCTVNDGGAMTLPLPESTAMSALPYHLSGNEYRADPLADETIARVIGTLNLPEGTSSAELLRLNADHFGRIREANRLMAQWTTNAVLADWRATPAAVTDVLDATVAEALESYVRRAKALPNWADPKQIERAETMFVDHGPLSCLLLFCASLPECYVLPDLADVLHVSGQLEQHTDYRIRSTAAMIFPVMMKGGLTTPEGSGVAQVLKVRLIHATIRHLILRGTPEAAIERLRRSGNDAAKIAAFALLQTEHSMQHSLFAHGWDIGKDQLPCNQEELVYTLLTFHYVFLRGMRSLRVPLSIDEETAYLHCWNVMAFVLGIEPDLMPKTMSEAEAQFHDIRARGRVESAADFFGARAHLDPRPKLGVDLMKSMENAIGVPILRDFPSWLTQRLCGAETARDIGIENRASIVARALFTLTMALVLAFDTLIRLFLPRFLLSSAITRMLGDKLVCKFLLDQTRPLKLPSHLLNKISQMRETWVSKSKR
jgi:hypothetical protein